MKDIPSPRKTRLDSESRFTRHFDNGKTRPAKPPVELTNPDRSCTYLVLRAHSDRSSYEKNQPSSFPEVAPQAAWFGPTLRGSIGPGGFKIR